MPLGPNDRRRLGQPTVHPGRHRRSVGGIPGGERDVIQRGLVEDPGPAAVTLRQPEVDQFGAAWPGVLARNGGEGSLLDGQLIDPELIMVGHLGCGRHRSWPS